MSSLRLQTGLADPLSVNHGLLGNQPGESVRARWRHGKAQPACGGFHVVTSDRLHEGRAEHVHRVAWHFRRADEALYKAKREGRSLVLVASDARTLAPDPGAATRGELTLLYQPIVTLGVSDRVAFLRKTYRRTITRYVHAGWIGALALGVVTWWIATTLVSVSGAGREVTEGVSSVFAAAVLLGVGFPVNALRGVPMLARTASLIAHLNEEMNDSIGFALSYQATREFEYTGGLPEARK